ncbi:MAG: DinB family protein, partial [Flavobacteriaceae bacterium]|nr:DinB family protein [Flavobacteriaceae bacterium]
MISSPTKSRLTEVYIKTFQAVRNHSVHLCKPLAVEDYIPQPMEDVSPPKWHLGHTTWFFETFILSKFYPNYQVFNADFGFLFNSYYNHAGERVLRKNRGFLTRPLVEEVYAYRTYVDEKMLQLLQNKPASAVLELLEIGLNHEQQHQELLVYDIKYIL